MNMILLALAALIVTVIAAAIAIKALGGNIALVDDWKKAWRYYSSYGLLLLAELPAIWAAAASEGLVSGVDLPEGYAWAQRAIAWGTFIVLRVKQIDRPGNPFAQPTK
jgi:hypothetical protein